MNALGIIAEYNPFHNGHQLHIRQAREQSGCRYVVCAMSGSFVQRGQPAIFDKWKRAELAVHGGADLVLELPFVYTVRSAQYFAAGGVRLLQALNVVSHMAFGAEHANLSHLQQMAALLDDSRTITILKNNLKTGQTYAAALGNAVQQMYGPAAADISQPNNILAIEYLRALNKFASRIQPVAISRRQTGYHDKVIAGSFASATAVRKALTKLPAASIRQVVPAIVDQQIAGMLAQGRGPADPARLDNLLLGKLRLAKPADIEQLPDVSEGLHFKISSAAMHATDSRQLIAAVKSKRYTAARLQRIFCHALFGTTKQQLAAFDASGPLYARVLAFNDNGRSLLRQIKATAHVPVITKTTHYLDSNTRHAPANNALLQMLAADTHATDLYSLCLPTAPWTQGGWDFSQSPIYLSAY